MSRRPTTSGFAFFDLDRTLLPGSSMVCLGQELLARGQLARRTLASGLLRNAAFRRTGGTDETVSKAQASMLRLVSGRSYGDMMDAVPAAAARAVVRVFPGARLLIEHRRRAGDLVAIVSASPQELVAAIATAVGADLGIGTRAEVIDGCFTGRLNGSFCYRQGKLDRISEELGAGVCASASAYADSGSDLPLLLACDRAVAVNPDRALRDVARTSRWPVIRFS